MAKFLSKDGKFYMRDGKLLRPTNILEVPIVTSNLTYNGKAQSPTIYGYDSNKMTMSGVTSGTDAGTYHITFTPKSGYKWSDDTSEAKGISWAIAQEVFIRNCTMPNMGEHVVRSVDDEAYVLGPIIFYDKNGDYLIKT